MWEKILNLFNYIGDHSGCHQIPERCFTIKEYTFPLCARCTGILIGQLAACIGMMFGLLIPFLVSLMFFCVMGIDGMLQKFHIKESTNPRRFITGLLGGYGFMSMILSAVRYMVQIILRML